MNVHLRYAFYGLGLGFLLSRIGFSDYGELHAMFVFSDFRLLLTFCSAVATAMALYAVMDRRLLLTRKNISMANIVGGVLFGLGWALTGACPSLALVNLGEGKLAAIVTLVGVLFGAYLYPPLARRLLPWRAESCEA